MLSSFIHSTGYNQTDIRLYNLGVIFRTIRDSKAISRADLAKVTGLNPATITHIVRELIDLGLVEDAGNSEPRSGRPSVLLRIRSQAGYVIAVHLDRYFMRGMITNLSLEEKTHSEIYALPSNSSRQITIDTLIQLIDSLIQDSGLPQEKFLGIGICAPGPLDSQHGILLTPNFPGWLRLPIREILEERFKLRVFLEQDANASALAEKMFGDMREARSFVFLLADGGLGGGVIIDGHVYRGQQGSAGEIGHTTIDLKGPKCNCGNVGCLELYASPHAVEEYMTKHLAQCSLETRSLFEDENEVTYEKITEAARSGDRLCRFALEQMAQALAAGMVNIANTFDPEAIVIGGKITLARDLIEETLCHAVTHQTLMRSIAPVPIRFSSLGQDVQIIGAFSQVLRELFQNPALILPVLQGINSRTTWNKLL